jgi:hypothetical protein
VSLEALTVRGSSGGTISYAGGGENLTYDGNSGRITQWASTAGSNTQTGNLTWNANGTLQELVISDSSNSGNNQTCTYGYDDLERLLSANCGSIAQTFSYNRFGNIWKNGHWTFNEGYGAGNRVTGFSYDNMGNVTYDGANSYTYDAEGRPGTAARLDCGERECGTEATNLSGAELEPSLNDGLSRLYSRRKSPR